MKTKRLSLSLISKKNFEIKKEIKFSDCDAKYYCNLCPEKRGGFRTMYLPKLYEHVQISHFNHQFFNSYIHCILNEHEEKKGKKIIKSFDFDFPETPSPSLKRSRDEKEFKDEDGKQLSKKLKFSLGESSTQTEVLDLNQALECTHFRNQNEDIIFFIHNILSCNDISKLYYSLLLATSGQDALFESFSKVGVTYSKAFCYQKPREVSEGNKKLRGEYSIVKYCRDIIFNGIKENNVFVAAVDNCDVKMPFAVKRKEIYQKNTGRVLFLMGKIDSQILLEIQSWKKSTIYQFESNTKVIDYISSFCGRKEYLKNDIRFIISSIEKGNENNIIPFQKNKRERNHNFLEKDVFKSKENFGKFLDFTLKEYGVVILPVEKHSCASGEDFKKMLNSILKYFQKKNFYLVFQMSQGLKL